MNERLWRLKKLHQSADAELVEGGDGSLYLQLRYNGVLALERRHGTRADALAEAAAKRTDLEREGWTAHW